MNAGRVAVLLVAACPLLTWSFLIGQETGLLAIAVAGLVWCLDRPERPVGSGWAALGGVFAITAGSTREYGLAYVAAAVVAATCLPATRRNALMLAAVAVPVAAAWPLRVWALTGNPFYSLDLGSMFPVNAAFVSWNDAFRAAQHSALGPAASWLALTRYLVLWALPAVLGLGALLALLVRHAVGVWLTAGLVLLATIVWLTSVAYTAGGLFYSLRVLAPAFALLAVPAARLISSISVSPAVARWLSVGLFVISLEALPKTLVLPDNPYRVPVLQWGNASRRVTDSFHGDEPEIAARLAALPGRRRVISDGFDLPATAAKLGFEVDPPWSPEVGWLSNRALDPVEAARQWRASGLRFLIVGKTGPMADYLQTHGRWRTPYYQIEAVDQTSGHIIYEIIPTGISVP